MSFDLDDPDSNDYEPIYARIENKYQKSCKILSTTCLIKSNDDINSIRDWFQMCTGDKSNISVFVAEWESYSSWLSKSARKMIDEILN